MTELNIEQERREFEAWYEADALPAESDWFKKDDDGDYFYAPTHAAWSAWLAAKRAVVGSAEPVAYMWQHDETGRIGFVELDQMEMDWQRNNPRNKIIGPVFSAPPSPVSAPAEPQKGDIAGWLRRRAGNDLVMIPGRLAGEIADHIDKLAAPVSAEPVKAQIDAAINALAGIDYIGGVDVGIKVLRNRIADLEQKNDAMFEYEKRRSAPPSKDAKDGDDAARYQWLRDHAAYVGINSHAKTSLWILRGIYEVPGAGFCEAIDAAIAAKGAAK